MLPCRYFFFRLIFKYTALLAMTRQSTMSSIVFSSTKSPPAIQSVNPSIYKKSTGIDEKTDAYEGGQWYTLLFCSFRIYAGGEQGKKEDDCKRVQAKTKTYCRRELDITPAHAAVFYRKDQQASPRQEKFRNPFIQSGNW
jgi:hypothetical protein